MKSFGDKVQFTYLHEDVQQQVSKALESQNSITECENGTALKVRVN